MYKRVVSILLIAAAPMAAGVEAHAQATGNTGFYGGLGAGRTRADIGTAGIAGSTDRDDNAWKAFGGYRINRNLAIEGGYVDLGKASVNGTRGGAPAFGSTDSTVWQAAAVGTLPLGRQFALTGKLGVARAETDTAGSIGGVPIGGTDHHTAPTYGVGLRYDVTKSFGVRGEWERFRTDSAALGGKSNADLYSLSAVFSF